MVTIWNEQIRPQTYGQIVGNLAFKKSLNEWIVSGSFPVAVLLHGPPGTGKTSAAQVIANVMLGKQQHDLNLLCTNASDDRGIGYIREEVKTFVRLSPIGVSRKVVILDEACGLTPASQDALRGIIEKYAQRAIFILTANYPEKIKPALKSRCHTFSFTPVSGEEGAKHLKRLTQECNAPVEWEDYYIDVVNRFSGDLRAATNWLQGLKRLPESLEHSPVEKAESIQSLVNNEWEVLRYEIDTMYDKTSSRLSVMNGFHRLLRKHIGTESDVVFTALAIWGDMMDKVHEWPGSDEAYFDVFVGRLKRELEMSY